MSIRVLVVDDQSMVRAGFAALLAAQDDIEVVGDAANGREAVEKARRFGPDVVLMDVRMPVMDGLEAARALLGDRGGHRAQTPVAAAGTPACTGRMPVGSVPGAAGAAGTPAGTGEASGEHRMRVLMLTTFDIDDYVYEALRIGASGFLLKDAPPADLIAAVRVVAAGEALLAPSVTRRLIEEFARQRPAGQAQGRRSERLDVLTAREREVLTLVARGMSNREIAADLVVAEQTVKTHIGRIFTKLDLRDRAQAVVFAYENALVSPRP